MTALDIYQLAAYATEYNSKDKFVAYFREAEDPHIYSVIWEIMHEDVRQLMQRSELTCAQFCRRYKIAYRTAQAWISGENKPPEHTLFLLRAATATTILL